MKTGRNGSSGGASNWGAGFLPSVHQGVMFRNTGDPVLYLSNPPGINQQVRRKFLDDLAELNQINAKEYGDPEILSRVAQYEMAYRMQTSVPELTDLSKESEKTLERYGPDARKPGTFASNCILARRLAERGATDVTAVCVVCAPEGIAAVTAIQENSLPGLRLVTAVIDDGLNDAKFIVPGLGDAGDRMYGTK